MLEFKKLGSNNYTIAKCSFKRRKSVWPATATFCHCPVVPGSEDQNAHQVQKNVHLNHTVQNMGRGGIWCMHRLYILQSRKRVDWVFSPLFDLFLVRVCVICYTVLLCSTRQTRSVLKFDPCPAKQQISAAGAVPSQKSLADRVNQ